MISFDDALKDCTKSLFRFEGLQDYSAEDGDDWVNHFIQTGQLKEHPDDRNEWWRDIKLMNERGIITRRVRLVIRPITDYTKMELAYLKEACSYSGDDIRIIEQSDFMKIAPEDLSDFWIIDDKYVFIGEYGSKGKWYAWNSVSSDMVNKYVEYKKALIMLSSKI